MLWKMIGAFVLVAQLTPVFADEDLETDLLTLVPEEANTLTVFRVKDFIYSPRGIKEDWYTKHCEACLNGGMTLPTWVEVMVRSSFFSPGALGGEWTAIAVPLPDDIKIEQIAAKEQTEVQKISNHPVVFVPRRQGYFVEFLSKKSQRRILAGMVPATRQSVARWIRDVDRLEVPIASNYLLSAVRDKKPQIIMAVDLAEMLDPVQIRFHLSGHPGLAQDTSARLALISDLQSLKGVRMSITVTQEVTAEIRFDFGRSIGQEGEYIKELFIGFLNDKGAALDELQDAEVDISGNSVTLSMPFSDESLRRVLSLLTTVQPPTSPETRFSSPKKTSEPPRTAEPGEIDVAKSLRYYKAVNHNIRDLERAYRRAKTYRQTAQWHDNFARRIEELPMTGVDPELLEYGRKISSLLRALAASLRGVGVKIDALNAQVRYDVRQTPLYTGAEMWWGVPYTAYGPYTYGRPMRTEVKTNLQEIRAKQAELIAKTEPEREKIWQMINDERLAIRQKMVAKYGKDFEKR